MVYNEPAGREAGSRIRAPIVRHDGPAPTPVRRLEDGPGGQRRYIVATRQELPSGERKIVEVAGRSVGIFNVDGEFYAVRNRCPHQGGPLCDGWQWGELSSTRPGEYVYGRPGILLGCPWHNWEFDLRSGQSWWDPARTRVRAYDVRVEPGEALSPDPEAPAAGMIKGPYTAETYLVQAEGEYVVLELGA